jgi:hypothetical protein
MPVSNQKERKRGAKTKAAPETVTTESNEPKKRGAPKGNQFWKIRATHGAPRLYEDPDLLWEDCQRYFEWVDATPFQVWTNTKAGLIQVPRIRPMTMLGLSLFLGIDQTTWREWAKTRKDLSPVITRVEAIIYEQKFAGAASEQFNANIIARDLGLADKKEHGVDAGLAELLSAAAARPRLG